MPIRLLDPEVAQKIAAGEVVERPASAVKELVENALDAGATQVQVEIRSGGLGLIRVVDDGEGIPADEVELAFVRHATSKLRRAEDLGAIQTLGFRGEALASIASVAQVISFTRFRGEELGTALTLEAGQLVERKPWAGAPGTSVQIRNLFFNVPARLKFLRSATSEAGQIGHLIEQFALGHPAVRFRFVNDDRRVLETPGSGELRDALRQVYGSAIAEAMIPIEAASESSALRIRGLVSLPDQTRATRAGLSFFVNGRRVHNASFGYALEEAYRPALPLGRHPIVALHLEIPANEVDCNVHPTKAEIRLVNERQVHGTLHKAVRAALLEVAPLNAVGASLTPSGWPTAPDWFDLAVPANPTLPGAISTAARPDFGPRPATTFSVPSPGSYRASDSVATSAASGVEQTLPLRAEETLPSEGAPAELVASDAERAGLFAAEPAEPIQPFRPTILRPVGQVQNTYIVAEGPGGVYFIDQHTAHERILYEEILHQRSGPNAPSQALLTPLVVQLNAQQWAALAEHGGPLGELGFALEEFGPDSFAVRAVPPRLARADLSKAIRDAADALSGDPVNADGMDRLAATLACHSAVRAGDPLTPNEIAGLLARLELTDVNRYCPHGRPVVVHLPVTQLEKDFHRR